MRNSLKTLGIKMNILKIFFSTIIKLLFTLLFVTLLYFFIASLLTFFPTKPNSTKAPKSKTIYLLYSQMHSDIVFNVQDINLTDLKEFNSKKRGYLAFGWGDKETYLNTPTWDDLKISTALKALFINTPSIMHVQYYKDIHIYQDIKTIRLTKEQFRRVINHIYASFKSPKKIYRGYGEDDYFYSSERDYNLFNTCNSWTGEMLREANVSMSIWTPLSQNIIKVLP